MQTTWELANRVREIMADTFGMDEGELPVDLSQETVSQWTSLYQVTLLLALEDEFGVTFSTEEMPEMTSLGKIVATLQNHGVEADA